MPIRGQNPLSFRCPVCLGKDMDIVLLKQQDEYYCIKCSFTGTEADILRAYAHFQERYKLLDSRLRVED